MEEVGNSTAASSRSASVYGLELEKLAKEMIIKNRLPRILRKKCYQLEKI